MRAHRFRIPIWCIVSTLAAFLQPLAALEPLDERVSAVRGLEQPALAPLEAGDDRFPHSFYPDLYGQNGEPTVLIVVSLEDPSLARPQWMTELPEGTAVLVVGSREDPTVAARLAAAIAPVGTGVPRVFLETGTSDSQWRVSVPGEVAPLSLTRAIAGSNPVPISLAELNAARLGFGQEDATLRAALNAEIPAARLSADTVVTATAALTALVEQRRNELDDGPDSSVPADARNYLVVPLRRIFIVPETTLVWSIVVTVALLLSFAIARPRRVRRYGRAIRHNALPILGLFLALSASLAAANGILRLLEGIHHATPAPLTLLVGKIAAAVLVLALVYPLLHIRLRRSSAVYSGASLILLLLGAVVAGAGSIILGTFFVAAFVFGVIFSVARPAWLKAIALAGAILPGAYLVVALAAVADPTMATALLRPPFWREVVTAVFLLPILLMVFRLAALTPRIPLLPIMVLASLLALAFVAAAVIVDTRDLEPIPVAVVETVRPDPGNPTGIAEVVVTATTSLGAPPERAFSVALDDEESGVVACSTLPCVGERAIGPAPVTLSTALEQNLDRYTLTADLAFQRPARRLEFRVTASAPVQLYAADLPAVQPIGATGESFRFLPGPYPPSDTSIRLILRRSSAGTSGEPIDIRIEAQATVDPERPPRLRYGQARNTGESSAAPPLNVVRAERRWVVTAREVIP